MWRRMDRVRKIIILIFKGEKSASEKRRYRLADCVLGGGSSICGDESMLHCLLADSTVNLKKLKKSTDEIAGHVAYMAKIRNTYRILTGNAEGFITDLDVERKIILKFI
jgi:hypothetical protein